MKSLHMGVDPLMLAITDIPAHKSGGEVIVLTPERATQLLEHNRLNRPLSDAHVKRLAQQIVDNKWRFNGDTIKISDTGDVLDGQHRCWAVIEAKKPVETIIVSGIKRDAFATIDTLRKPRSGGDVCALNGVERHRNQVAGAIAWLLRYQSGNIETWKAPSNRIENADIEEAFIAHNHGIQKAVERAMTIRRIANAPVMAFVFYVAAHHNEELAEQMIARLADPGRLPQSHPFYQLGVYFRLRTERQKDPVVSIAYAFKALNAAAAGKPLHALNWRRQGKKPDPFPTLSITPTKGK